MKLKKKNKNKKKKKEKKKKGKEIQFSVQSSIMLVVTHLSQFCFLS